MNGAWTQDNYWQQYEQFKLSECQQKCGDRLLDASTEGIEGGMTTQQYALMTHCSQAMAFRELARLFQIGVIQRVGKGERGGISCYCEVNGNTGDRFGSRHFISFK